MKACLTTGEVAQALGCTRPTVRAWVDSGLLRGFRVQDAARRIPLAAAVAFARQHGLPTEGLERSARQLGLDLPGHLAAVLYVTPAPSSLADLAEAGFDVAVSPNVMHAGRLLDCRVFDVVLLDLATGRRDIELLLSDLRQRPAVPVAVLLCEDQDGDFGVPAWKQPVDLVAVARKLRAGRNGKGKR